MNFCVGLFWFASFYYSVWVFFGFALALVALSVGFAGCFIAVIPWGPCSLPEVQGWEPLK